MQELAANTYQKYALRTARTEESSKEELLENAAMGLNGEAGEVIDLIKKHKFQGHKLDKGKIVEEVGDVLWYCALAAYGVGMTLEDIMKANIAKLSKRYPEGFDKKRSIEREA